MLNRIHAQRGRERTLSLDVGKLELEGTLAIPTIASGIVLFAHGSGSSRHSPRNQAVARHLQSAGLATLLIDLLTPNEESADQYTRHLRFDIPMLADRLIGAVDWLRNEPDTQHLPIGLFGASTGAAAALIAAASRPMTVHAVVSRGGRPDLAGDALSQVTAPTLLIVGGNDLPVIELNRQAAQQMRVEPKLKIVLGASHLFEEPGALEQVARLAVDWFTLHLSAHSAA
ncbi:MAG TPA: alpha/beta family hydrolase [Oceanobacillus sp.]|nr:alpha/beta family hydrolase [Oceanobacillus sp.]